MIIGRITSLMRARRYLSSRIVLLIEASVSSFASLCAILLSGFVSNQDQGSDIYIILYIAIALGASLLVFMLSQTYRIAVRYTTLLEMGRLMLALVGKSILLGAYIYAWHGELGALRGVIIIDFLLSLCFLMLSRFSMILVYQWFRERVLSSSPRENILVYGADTSSNELAMYLRHSDRFRVVGLLTMDSLSGVNALAGLSVYEIVQESDLIKLKDRLDLRAIIFPNQESVLARRDDLLRWLPKAGLRALTLSAPKDITEGKPAKPDVRNIKIEDLLGRPEIEIQLDLVAQSFTGKTVLVTGGAGSIGAELCRQLATFGLKHLVILDNAETPMYQIKRQLEQRFPKLKLTAVVGDVRLLSRLDFVFRSFSPDIVFHAAAYKHVPLMEDNPCEAVLVNTIGSRNVADKCVEYRVEKMVMISTDKAVNPTNIMGCTKRLAEIYVQSLGLAIERGEMTGRTKFVTTRFGNVLGSNGSVIPLFQEQIERGGPVTVTHPEITRFFMTIPEACRLVMEAVNLTDGNQIFVFDMGESVKIAHLAERMIELAGYKVGKDIQIEFTGLRPGEKLYEEVLSSTENTIPTGHARICIAKVRDYEYTKAEETLRDLERLSRQINITDLVRLMKQTVPEYISQNSDFERFDY